LPLRPDHALVADLLHRLGKEAADLGVSVGGNGSDLRDFLVRSHLLIKEPRSRNRALWGIAPCGEFEKKGGYPLCCLAMLPRGLAAQFSVSGKHFTRIDF
jgi:hypothetical protein